MWKPFPSFPCPVKDVSRLAFWLEVKPTVYLPKVGRLSAISSKVLQNFRPWNVSRTFERMTLASSDYHSRTDLVYFGP